MAESPSHRFGQVVGNLLEEILLPELLHFCDDRGLYLDRHGVRKNVRKGKKVSWEDKYGNSHDLDFVIEKAGSENERGRPVAFIEAAWRRYTKHSRAKAQEIQGAVLPIAEKYELDNPFLGAVLAGIFTSPSLSQLKSLNFNIVYIPYEIIVQAFAIVGIDARFDETTPDVNFKDCVDAIERLDSNAREIIKEHILAESSADFSEFFKKLERKLDRITKKIVVVPLFGSPFTFDSVEGAASFLKDFDCTIPSGIFQNFEVQIRFSNSDEVRGTFADYENALHFLRYVTT